MHGVMRDDQLPMGGILQNPDITDATLNTHPGSGRIRRLYAECKALATPDPTASSTTLAISGGRTEWEGAPPPTLSLEAMTAMEKSWRENYTGEVLDDNNLPGPRYWSLAFHMLKGNNPKRHEPWTMITSKREEDGLVARRAARLPRSEVQSLLDAYFEDQLELPENEITDNPWKQVALSKRGGSLSVCVERPTSHLSSS